MGMYMHKHHQHDDTDKQYVYKKEMMAWHTTMYA